jgi:hypothetical protein
MKMIYHIYLYIIYYIHILCDNTNHNNIYKIKYFFIYNIQKKKINILIFFHNFVRFISI